MKTNNGTLGFVVVILVVGSVVLAFIDPATRPAFLDLTKFALGTFVGFLIPTSKR